MQEAENFVGNNLKSQPFLARQVEGGLQMKRRKVDREKIERADRESRLVLDAERQAREAKTARLREQRLKKATEILLAELNRPGEVEPP